MFLLHFIQDSGGSTKYSLEALFHMFQVFALLSSREAERVIWNRTVKNKVSPGCNVAMDLVLEHENHLVKEMIRGLGANISVASVRRICRPFFVLKFYLQNLDQEMKVKKTSGEHTTKSAKKDLKKVVKTLQELEVFEKQATRDPMFSFPDCPRDYLELLDAKGVSTWISDHKTKVRPRKRPC